MNVYFIANRLYALSNSRSALISSFLDQDCNVYLVARKDEFYSFSFHPRLFILGYDFQAKKNDTLSLFAYLSFVIRVLSVLCRAPPSLIYSYNYLPNLLSVILGYLFRCPTILTVTGFGRMASFLDNRIFARLILWPLNLSSSIYVQNSYDLKVLSSMGVCNQKLHQCFGSGVDLLRFFPKNINSATAFTVLVTSRCLFDKGILFFHELATHFNSLNSDIRFIWAGEISLSTSEPDLQMMSGFAFHYLGRSDNVPDLLRSSSLLLSPSLYREGLPRSILEASSCGIPSLAFDLPWMHDCILNDVNGFLFPKNDILKAAEIIHSLYTDQAKYSRLCYTSRQFAERYFDVSLIANQYYRTGVELVFRSS